MGGPSGYGQYAAYGGLNGLSANSYSAGGLDYSSSYMGWNKSTPAPASMSLGLGVFQDTSPAAFDAFDACRNVPAGLLPSSLAEALDEQPLDPPGLGRPASKPPAKPEPVLGLSMPSSRFRSQMWKTEMCRFYSRGKTCSKGNACPFAHARTEKQGRPDLTKTSLCRNWMSGCCEFEAKDCKFAHGEEDRRYTQLYQQILGKRMSDKSQVESEASTYSGEPDVQSNMSSKETFSHWEETQHNKIPAHMADAMSPMTVPLPAGGVSWQENREQPAYGAGHLAYKTGLVAGVPCSIFSL